MIRAKFPVFDVPGRFEFLGSDLHRRLCVKTPRVVQEFIDQRDEFRIDPLQTGVCPPHDRVRVLPVLDGRCLCPNLRGANRE